jgi:predicted O-methyltransferase YrrM
MASISQRINHYSRSAVEWLGDSALRPLNQSNKWAIQLQTKLNRKFRSPNKPKRHFNYDPVLLPNPYLAEQDKKSQILEDAFRDTGFSIGYPAWNLLYYSLYTSLHFTDSRKPVIVETGTNQGFSTIILAQVLKDLNIDAKIMTVEFNPDYANIARENVAKAGLSDYVEFYVQDSLQYLRELVTKVDCIDFAFLDGNHEYKHVRQEFSIIYSKVVACGGKVYLDNTASGGVARTIRHIKRAYGGNVVEFLNCSWRPPGNAIWQG